MSNKYCQLHETTETLSSIWSPLSPLLLVSLAILMNKEMLFIKLDSKLIFFAQPDAILEKLRHGRYVVDYTSPSSQRYHQNLKLALPREGKFNTF